jgi:2-polyprenyl-3-methyl-5-hydroxy-6-metoxy-1,4-benzoquinol methylase
MADTSTIDEQRRFWDWHWQNWVERKAINDWVLKRGGRVLDIVSSLTLDRPKILDLGCGIGWFSQELSKFGQVTGIDLSEDAIAKAKASYPHITFLAGNVLADALPEGHFDVVVSQEVLAHVEDQPKYLQVAANVLRPGGYLILTTANKFVLDRLGASISDPWPREHIEKFLDMKGLKRLLFPHFRVLRTTTFLPLGNAGILRLINSHKLNTALSLLIPERYLETLKERAGFGYSLLVLAQRVS